MMLKMFNCAFSVVTQDYSIYMSPTHVIRGNDVLLKCDIPSFVSDFVIVTEWVDSENVSHSAHSIGNWSQY